MPVTEVPPMDVGASEARTVVVPVPPELVDGVRALIQLYVQELPQFDKAIVDEMQRAKALGALVALRELKRLREQASRMYAPIHRATLMLRAPGADTSGDDVGRIAPRTHTLFGHTWKDGPLDMVPMPAAGVLLSAGESAAAAIVTKVGVDQAAARVAETAVASQVASRTVGATLKQLATRGVLPVLGIAGLTSAFQSCGKLIGIGVAVGALLKFAGSKAGKRLLGDALPWVLLIGGGLYLMKKKGR